MSCRLRRWTILLSVSCGLLAGLYTARGAILPLVARWLDVGCYPQSADYVMVLGGGVDSRPFAAAALVKAGLVRRVLVSHVRISPSVLDGSQLPDDQIVRRILVARGVPEDAISIIGQENASTYDEARALDTLLEAMPDARVLVLTNDFHTRRTRWIFGQVLGSRSARVSIVSTPSEEFRFDQWWRNEQGFMTIAGENLKILLYVMYYGRSFHATVLVAVLVAVVAVAYRRCRRRSSSTAAG